MIEINDVSEEQQIQAHESSEKDLKNQIESFCVEQANREGTNPDTYLTDLYEK